MDKIKKIKVLDSTYEVHESHLKNGQEKGLIQTLEKFEAAYQKTAGGARENAGRPTKDWKPLNLKIDAELSDYLDSLCVDKGDKTKIIETLVREHKSKRDASI